jgi:hypothetical protein
VEEVLELSGGFSCAIVKCMSDSENQSSEAPEKSAEAEKIRGEVRQIRQKLSSRLINAMGQKDEERIRATTEEIQKWDFDTTHITNVDEVKVMVERKKTELGM